jgi:protein SCO1
MSVCTHGSRGGYSWGLCMNLSGYIGTIGMRLLPAWVWLFVCCTWPHAAQAGGSNFYQLPYNFVDESGRSVQLKQWRNRDTLVTMEYASCQFICSAAVTALKSLQRIADERHTDYDFIIISLDPTHDTPDAWRHYRQVRGLDRASWHYLTPTQSDLPRIASVLGIRYWFDGQILMHDFRVVRFDAQGAVVHALDGYGDNWKSLLATP